MECDAQVTNELPLPAAAAAANQLASCPEIQPDTYCTGPVKPQTPSGRKTFGTDLFVVQYVSLNFDMK